MNILTANLAMAASVTATIFAFASIGFYGQPMYSVYGGSINFYALLFGSMIVVGLVFSSLVFMTKKISKVLGFTSR